MLLRRRTLPGANQLSLVGGLEGTRQYSCQTRFAVVESRTTSSSLLLLVFYMRYLMPPAVHTANVLREISSSKNDESLVLTWFAEPP